MEHLHKIEEEIIKLPLAELYQLHAWLQELIRIEQKKADRETRAFLEHQAGVGITYRQEYIKCGKEHCKCVNGQGHGPYWYAYWNENGQTRKKYIGKSLKKISS